PGRIPSFYQHPILKGMDQLVTQNMSSLLIDLHDRHHDTLFKSFCNTACPNTDLTGNSSGLLEFRMVVIKDNWVFSRKGILEYLLMQFIPHFRFLRKPIHHGIILQIIINIEMWGIINLEIKLLIPHLILPKILSFGFPWHQCHKYSQNKINA